MTEIIQVSLNDSNEIYYKLRTTLLSTKDYGAILAKVAEGLAAMFASEGQFDKDKVLAEIAHWFSEEITHPSAEITVNQLQ